MFWNPMRAPYIEGKYMTNIAVFFYWLMLFIFHLFTKEFSYVIYGL